MKPGMGAASRQAAIFLAIHCALFLSVWADNYGGLGIFFQAAFGSLPGSEDVCKWPGVKCSSTNGQIEEVKLDRMNITGSIPAGSLGMISTLRVLSLANNSLTGSLPGDLWHLGNLVHLDLSQNEFSGSIPQDISNLAQLEALNLSSNRFGGGIHPNIGGLRNLSLLNFSRNLFNGEIPFELFNCANLQVLDLSFNNLTGILAGGLSRLHYLNFLDLSNNMLAGHLPNLRGSRALETLSLSGNRFDGPVPASFFGLPLLETLLLANNSLTGPLPLPSTPISLKLVDLSYNFLNGTVPFGFWNIQTLEVLRLHQNNLTGGILPTIGPQMTELDLNNNMFTGFIPTMTNGINLQYLDLSSNKLQGRLPRNLSALVSIQYLNLGGNAISAGPFPAIHGMNKVSYLNLAGSSITGQIPLYIGELRTLEHLDLSYNQLSGSIPSSIGNLSSLLYLDLSHNKLNGSIPNGIWTMKNLKLLDLAYNNLTGTVPENTSWRNSSFTGNAGLCFDSCGTGEPLKQTGLNCKSENRHSHSHTRLAIIVGIMLGSLIIVSLLLGIAILYNKGKKKMACPSKEEKYVSVSGPFSSEISPSAWAAGIREPASIQVVMFEKPLLNLTFADLLQATSNFNRETQVSDGGYGPVFRAVLMGEIHVAIKILKAGKASTEAEATAELEALGNLKHPNLVPLLGYCLVGLERILIYEFMDSGDLNRRLRDLPEGTHDLEDWSQDTWEEVDLDGSGEALGWSTRHRIALGIARALAFLHHGCIPPIIHNDVKSSNILLDAEYEPHLADCGLAGIMLPEDLIKGSDPYSAPEYEQVCEPTAKGDVYSFGVVLLEIVTGRTPTGGDCFPDGGNHGPNLVSWVRSLVRDKRGVNALDSKLVKKAAVTEMLETLRIAYLCTAENPNKRPTMQQVVGLLKDLQPGQYTP